MGSRLRLGQQPDAVPVPIRLIQQAANAHGIPIPVTGIWDAATARAWMLLIPVLGLPGAVAVGLTTEGPAALLPPGVDIGIRVLANTPFGPGQITLQQVAQAIVDARDIRQRYAGLPFWYRLRFRKLFEAWIRSTEAVIKDLSGELEGHPTLLAAVAAYVGKPAAEVLSIMRTPIVPKPGGRMGPAPAGPQTPLGLVIADDVLVAIAVIAAAVIAVLVVGVIIYSSIDTVRDFTTQLNQTLCVKIVLDAAARSTSARAAAASLPAACQIPNNDWVWWSVGGAAATVGIWWWYRRREARRQA